MKAEDLKQLRKSYNLTQVEVAHILHTDVRSVKRWEAGDRVMHKAFAELLQLKVIGCTVSLDS